MYFPEYMNKLADNTEVSALFKVKSVCSISILSNLRGSYSKIQACLNLNQESIHTTSESRERVVRDQEIQLMPGVQIEN